MLRQTGRLMAGCTVLLLSGCAETASTGSALSSRLIGPAKPDAAKVLVPPGSGREGLRLSRGANRKMTDMIEAPDLFSDRRDLTWSGNDTLGGLWIAHGGIDRAYRVRATNLRTGIVVDGALLPRHGPASEAVVVSAEAASSLGMLPGRPEEITLVAILPAPLEPPPEVVPAVMVAEAAATNSAPDPGSAAAPAEPAASPAAEPVSTPSAEAPAIDLAALDGSAAFAPPKTEERPKEADSAPKETRPRAPRAEEPAEVAAASPQRTSPAAAQPAQPAPQAATPDPAREAPAARTEQRTEEAARTPVEPAEARAAAAPSSTDGGIADGKPFVASGTLKTNALASDLVRTLSAYGVSARNVPAGDKHRVIAGPFRTEKDREKALGLFRAIGVYGATATAG